MAVKVEWVEWISEGLGFRLQGFGLRVLGFGVLDLRACERVVAWPSMTRSLGCTWAPQSPD